VVLGHEQGNIQLHRFDPVWCFVYISLVSNTESFNAAKVLRFT